MAYKHKLYNTISTSGQWMQPAVKRQKRMPVNSVESENLALMLQEINMLSSIV